MKTHLLSAIAVAIAVSSAAAQWTQMAPLASPSARSGSAAAVAPTGEVVIFGGNLLFGATDEVWSYDGATWTGGFNIHVGEGSYSYPSLVPTPGGVAVSYTYSRVAIVCRRFRIAYGKDAFAVEEL
jgi:opacity protein-like surface antigen